MRNLIKTIKVSTMLYRQPHRIGDVIEYQGKMWLIIGIQWVSITYSQLEIEYVCQNLEQDFAYPPTTPHKGDDLREFFITIKTGKEYVLEHVRLGRIFWYNDMPFQTIEYTDIEIQFTDIIVSFLARPIRPVARKEAKAKLIHEKKKKLKLSLI
ncbi:hypothetical protein [Bacillus alveayuensis]|jgi:hypothetical protein|uniref:hypothetical protein n=1 Tax=Aeribacillus alveayuensis TaxID=279215 RepID=UPI0005D109BD|nr:hypothetical protein [Bacillus alveayuensis]